MVLACLLWEATGWLRPGESLEVVWSNPLLRWSHLELVAPQCVQVAFDCFQGWRLHNLPGQLVPVLGHPQSEKGFPDA